MRKTLIMIIMSILLASSVLAIGPDMPVINLNPADDIDSNGYPDVGIVVSGHYKALFAIDENGDFYWDLGNGIIFKTVDSVDELDQATKTVCTYNINYKGTFENNKYLDTGWVHTRSKCKGYADNNTYNDIVVHESDPRYSGDPDWQRWNDWEITIFTISGRGNVVKK